MQFGVNKYIVTLIINQQKPRNYEFNRFHRNRDAACHISKEPSSKKNQGKIIDNQHITTSANQQINTSTS